VYVAKNGMPGLRGEMLLGKLRQAGHDYDYSEPSAEGCVFRLHRGHQAPVEGFEERQCGQGRDYFGQFTQDDAVRARLLTRDKEGNLVARSQYGEPMPHELYAPDMMYWRAAARAIRRGAPEITLGFTIAELDDGEPSGPAPGPVPAGPPTPVATPRHDAAGLPGDVRAEVLDLERQMTPAAGDDTLGGPGPAAAGTAGRPEGPGPVPGEGDRTQADPRAAGAASARGAQPPPPQDPTSPPGTTGPGGPEQDAMFTDDPRPMLGAGAPDPPPARSAGTRKAGTSRGSSSARLAESPWYDVADLFDQLGWPPARHKRTVLAAVCSYARRPVRDITELTRDEAEQVASRLGAVRAGHQPGHWPVALADEVETWRQEWAKADPDGYAKASPG
jgi:hypothetical protein